MTRAERSYGRGGRAARRWRRLAGEVSDGRHTWVVAAAVFGGYVVWHLRLFGTTVQRWDTMVLSAWLTATFGLWAAERLPDVMDHTLRRLGNRDLLPAGANHTVLSAKLHAVTRRWSLGGGVAVAGILAAAATVAFGEDVALKWPWFAAAVPGAFLVGLHLGRMVGYGRLGAFLRDRGAMPAVSPGYVDGAAGLKPVGDFFFRQAMLLAVPAAYLAVWLVLIPLVLPRYEHWQEPYLWLLVVAVALEVVAFVAPMVRFHRHMTAKKRQLLDKADQYAQEVADIDARMAADTGDTGAGDAVPVGGDVDELRERRQWVQQRFEAIESLPTWPVDTRTRRRFSLNNVGLLLPVVGHVVGRSELWSSLGEALQAW